MSDTVLELAYQLTQAREPFVLATVVWCERPTSAKPGARAMIQPDGHITGWIGGSCSQPIVVREATRMLREGADPCLLHLGEPDTGTLRPNVRAFPMTCTSGGILEIYMEPHLPSPQLVLVGDSPVITALLQLAPVLDFAVTHLDHADLSQVRIDTRTYVLVATHGQYDEDILEQALPSPAAYIGMVGSHRRADACRAYLRESGLAAEHIARLKAPAGLNIGAVTPEEIAASILAELVQVQRDPSRAVEHTTASSNTSSIEARSVVSPPVVPTPAETALDPVCGMIIEIAGARHRSTYEGQDFFFCCPACKRLFERNPQEYLAQKEISNSHSS